MTGEYCGMFLLYKFVLPKSADKNISRQLVKMYREITLICSDIIIVLKTMLNCENAFIHSKKFQLKTSTKKKIGTDQTLEDQIRIYKTKKSILDRPSGPVVQRIEALSLYCSRWALSEDSGFKSYPSRPEVYLVKNVVR